MGLNSMESLDPNRPRREPWSRLSSSMNVEEVLDERTGVRKRHRSRGSLPDLQTEIFRRASSYHRPSHGKISDYRKEGKSFNSPNMSYSKEKSKNVKNTSGDNEKSVQKTLLNLKFCNVRDRSSRSQQKICHKDTVNEEVNEKYVEDEMRSEKSYCQLKTKKTHAQDKWINLALDERLNRENLCRESKIGEMDSNRLCKSRETPETNIRTRQRYNSETMVKEPCYEPVENEEFIPEKGDLSKDDILDSLSKDFSKHGFVEWKVLEKVELNVPDVLLHLLENGTITMKQIKTELEAIKQTYGPDCKSGNEDECHYKVDCTEELEEKPGPVEVDEDFNEEEEKEFRKSVDGFGGLDKEDLSIEFKEMEVENENEHDIQIMEKSTDTKGLKICKDIEADFAFIQVKLLELKTISTEMLSHQFDFETIGTKYCTDGMIPSANMKSGLEKKRQKLRGKSADLNPVHSLFSCLYNRYDGLEDWTKSFPWSGKGPRFIPKVYKTRTCKGGFQPDPPNGRGDNPSCYEMTESDTDRQNSHGSQRSDEQEETEKEKGRKNDDEKDRDENEIPPTDDGNHNNNSEDMVSRNLEVIANFKYRRKHGSVPDGESGLIDLLGLILNENDDLKVPPDIFEEINLCLMTSMQVKSAGETTNCYICSHLSALICHFGSCETGFQNPCPTCLTMFRLIQKHVSICGLSDSFTSEVTCPVIICVKIKRAEIAFDNDEKVWRKLKKNLARFANPDVVDDDPFSSISSFGSIGSIVSGKLPSIHAPGRQRLSTVTRPTLLESIPEGGIQMGLTSPRRPSIIKNVSRSEPIMMKKPDGTVVMTGKLPRRLMQEDQKSVGLTSLPQQSRYVSLGSAPHTIRPRDICTDSTDHPLLPDPKVRLNSPREGGATGFTFEALGSPRSLSESDCSAHNSLPAAKDSSLEHLSTNGNEYISLPSHVFGGQDVYTSIPINRQQSEIWDRYQSLVDRPTGIPGIQDVVYGERQYLLAVARIWFGSKNQLVNARKDSREEGVILPKYKDLLKILKTRYSKNFQWVRLSHLGSGTSGKCHLAMDFTTEFKFCIKKIHISKYEVKEVEIWSELQHKNIVQLIGTLRRGEKIYIMSEFIDGGCLTETINQQRSLSRRLSQKTALNYLKQILEALIYLQKKYVIHEDLKADNILVRSGTQDVVITDFGVARKHTSAKDKRGSTTSGSQIVFSPEKARGEGHGYKSDLWSAICVFYHMLTGYPPWVRKYPNLGALLYVIIEQEPDIPGNVDPDISDLIRMGFEKDPSLRPSPDQLLQHKAFKLTDGSGQDILYSTLVSSMPHFKDATKLQPHVLKGDNGEIDIIEEIEEDIKNKVDSIREERLSSLRNEESGRCPVENEEPSDNENLKNSSIDFTKLAKDLGLSLPEDATVREEEPPDDPLQQFLMDNGEMVINQAGLEEYETSTEKQSSDTEQSFSEIDFEENPQSILPHFQLLFSKEENLTEQEKRDKQARVQMVEDHHEKVLNSQLSRSESHNRSFDSQLSSRAESTDIPQERILEHISDLPVQTRSSLEVPNLTLFKESSSISSEKVTLKAMPGSQEQIDSKDSEKSTSIATTISSLQAASSRSTNSSPSPRIEISSSMCSIEEEDDFDENDLFGSGEGDNLLQNQKTFPNRFGLGHSNINAKKLYLDLSPVSRRRKFMKSREDPNTADIQSNTSPVPPTAPYYTPQTSKPPPFQSGAKSKSSNSIGLLKTSSQGSTENSGGLSSSLSQQQEEYERLMDEFSNNSAGAGAELNMSQEIEGEEEEKVKFKLEDDDDMDASLAYVNENYLNSTTTPHGIRLMVHHNESGKTFTMEISGSTVRQTWKDIIQDECYDHIQMQMNVNKFLLLDGKNQPLDLHRSPSQEDQFLLVEELDDTTNAPWYCELGMIM